MLDLFLLHTIPLEFNRTLQVEFIFDGVRQLGAYSNRAFSCELACVIYEVEDNLLKSPPIQAENGNPWLFKFDLNLTMGLIKSDYLHHLKNRLEDVYWRKSW